MILTWSCFLVWQALNLGSSFASFDPHKVHRLAEPPIIICSNPDLKHGLLRTKLGESSMVKIFSITISAGETNSVQQLLMTDRCSCLFSAEASNHGMVCGVCKENGRNGINYIWVIV